MPAEQPVRIPVEDFTLEGALHLPDGDGPFPAIVCCHPHPRWGGDMYSNVVMAVVRGALARGIAALRFNFRGAGGSGGSHANGIGEQDDVRAAVTFLRAREEIDPIRLGVMGYSFGAAVAGRSVDDSIGALMLVALPISEEGFDGDALYEYEGPVLLASGDRDAISPSAWVTDLAAVLGDRAEAHAVPDADHFWAGFEPVLADLAGDFLASHLVDG